MLMLAAAIALQCNCPLPKPKPIHYTRQMRLEDSFKLLSRQPVTYKFLYN